MRRTLVWAAVAATGLATAGGVGLMRAAPALKEPDGVPWPGPDPAIFLGCGESGGPGTVVQFDLAGRVIGTIHLTDTPYGLAADHAGLVAALPAQRAGRVVRID